MAGTNLKNNNILDYNTFDLYEFNITSYCNAKCPTCARFSDDPPYDLAVPLIHLDKNAIIRTFEYMAKMSAEKLKDHSYHALFIGDYGDPLMHPDIEELLKASYDLSLPTQIHTNGGLRTPEFFERVAYNYPHVGFIFSVDGLEDTNHIYRRDTDSTVVFENMMAFSKASKKRYLELLDDSSYVDHFLKYDLKHMLDKSNRLTWKFICFDYNYHQIDEAFRRCQENDIRFEVRINRRMNQKGFNHTISDNNIKELIIAKSEEWKRIQKKSWP